MSISKWKDLAEIIALVAVIGSLVAVAVELRQTQAALQAQAYPSRAFDGIAQNLAFSQDEALARLAELIVSSEIEPTQLDPVERRKALYILTILRIDLDNEHYQFEKGLLDPGFYYGETVEAIRALSPIWRLFGRAFARRLIASWPNDLAGLAQSTAFVSIASSAAARSSSAVPTDLNSVIALGSSRPGAAPEHRSRREPFMSFAFITPAAIA